MTSAIAEPTPRLLLSSLRSAVQTFHSLRNDTPVNMVVLFLLIAERGKGVGAADLVKLAGVSHASVSRNVQALGRGKEGEPGLGLVRKIIDPGNPRAHITQLTKNGRALADRMAGELAAALRMEHSLEMPLGSHDQSEAIVATQVLLEPFSGVHWEMWAD